MQRRLAAGLVALALSAPAGASASAALRPLFSKRSSYGESFTFIGDLEDGSYVQLSLGLTNLGPGSTKGLCRALVIPPAGAPWKASTRTGRDGFSWHDGDEERLTVATCSAWLDGAGAGAEVRLEQGRVRLAFAAPLAHRSPHDAAVAVGEERYQAEVLLHRVPVTATLALPGQPARTVAGAGYADHSRSTVQPRDLARRWIRFRGLRGPRGVLLLGREGHDGSFAPLWGCFDPGTCHDYASFRIDRQGPERAPAFRAEVVGADGPVQLRSGRLLYRDAPVEDLGLLGKLVAPFTGSPVTYVYRATAAAPDGAPVDGVLEIELAEE